ncbi:MerR family transcriptional regulator [Pseudomonas sp. GD03858]|uniref:MerR family transcriptional regulator n=1 Tax=unclassified Pseudomonas TaxID=196821 RepID=UPI002446921F|nr:MULTISPECIES: MerR family transcriptional regulator [unclassified Pseudomonas]MDH0645735.1 MerR family transcriptional regulator [Pseudomonas sp. GD03867]MDH0661158.1 MerR family transcriptional regulator [Pseudomonas sp. GD03858]
MYRISELAAKLGLARSTLLYYEKLGLLSSRRQANGYRHYSEQDLQQLRLLQQLQAGGLSLKECQACLQGRMDRSVLLARLHTLDEQIAARQRSRDLLAAMLGLSSMRPWHQVLERQAPGAHLAWLRTQGFSEKQALRLKWLSRDMNEHERYMADFERIFDGLQHLGPGSSHDSLEALRALPRAPTTLLEIGCGRGATSVLLAEHSQARITALDNDEHSLGCLRATLADKGLQDRVTPVCASMTRLPFAQPGFDTLWAEGCAYIMGFDNALKYWRPFIKPQGCLVVSDLVRVADRLAPQAEAFWQAGYPDLQSVDTRLASIARLGYRTLLHFPLSPQAWANYLGPLRERVSALADETFASQALADIKRELEIHENHLGEYGYHLFVMQTR